MIQFSEGGSAFAAWPSNRVSAIRVVLILSRYYVDHCCYCLESPCVFRTCQLWTNHFYFLIVSQHVMFFVVCSGHIFDHGDFSCDTSTHQGFSAVQCFTFSAIYILSSSYGSNYTWGQSPAKAPLNYCPSTSPSFQRIFISSIRLSIL